MKTHFAFPVDYASDWLVNYARSLAAPPPWAIYTRDIALYDHQYGGVVWLFTLLPGQDSSASLCGRLVLAGARVNHPAQPGYDPRYPGEYFAIDADRQLSQYIVPVACPLLGTLIARANANPPRTPIRLDAMQAEAMEEFWTRAAKKPLTNGGVGP